MAKNSNNSLIKLLQLSDSALPLGAYSHSWGMETLVQTDQLKNATEVREALESLLIHSIGPREAAAALLAHKYSLAEDTTSFAQLNTQLSASNWTRELEHASTSMGARLRVLAGNLKWLDGFVDEPVHHCALFGWLCGTFGVDARSAVSAYLCNACTALISACVKLVPLGHTDGQKVLAGLGKTVDQLTKSLCSQDPIEITSFAPLQEWASFEHENLYSRLFQS